MRTRIARGHSTSHFGFVALAILAALASSTPAKADVKAACVAASTQGQALRDAAKLKGARDQFLLCARDECPNVVRKYCAEWLSDVERRIPSVVFRVQSGNGNDVTDARVTVDGTLVVNGLDGSAITLDPGAHDVRYERPGEPAVSDRFVIVEGERGRVLTGRFPTKSVPVESIAITPATSARPIPPITYVLGGVGLVGIAGFAYFGLTASHDLDHLRTTCAPFCATADLDSARHEALFADIALGVGVVALGAAAYTFFTRPNDTPSAATLIDVRPLPGGGMARIGASF
jgi:hypothetical protein